MPGYFRWPGLMAKRSMLCRSCAEQQILEALKPPLAGNRLLCSWNHDDLVKRSSECSFCRFISGTISGHDGVSDSDPIESIFITANATPFETGYHLRLYWRTIAAQYSVSIYPFSTSSNVTRQYATVFRKRIKQQVNFAKVNDWLKSCGLTVPQRPVADPCSKSIRLVDTHSLCVVEADFSRTYVCLSYVWGQSAIPKITKANYRRYLTRGSINAKTVEDAYTIRDAMKIVKWLGFRYLWVDCLCIVQDDHDDTSTFIPQMGQIYRSAALTLVSDSPTAATGIPGISKARTHPSSTFDAHGYNLISSRPQLSEVLKVSSWYKRGWTLQEMCFSDMILFFSDAQIFLQKDGVVYSEEGGSFETRHKPGFLTLRTNNIPRPQHDTPDLKTIRPTSGRIESPSQLSSRYARRPHMQDIDISQKKHYLLEDGQNFKQSPEAARIEALKNKREGGSFETRHKPGFLALRTHKVPRPQTMRLTSGRIGRPPQPLFKYDQRPYMRNINISQEKHYLLEDGKVVEQDPKAELIEALKHERKEEFQEQDGTYRHLVQIYAGRNLTYEDDILKAFDGVLAYFEERLGKAIWGLPVKIFDQAMLWRIDRPSQRRPQFPSWSWAGWLQGAHSHLEFLDSSSQTAKYQHLNPGNLLNDDFEGPTGPVVSANNRVVGHTIDSSSGIAISTTMVICVRTNYRVLKVCLSPLVLDNTLVFDVVNPTTDVKVTEMRLGLGWGDLASRGQKRLNFLEISRRSGDSTTMMKKYFQYTGRPETSGKGSSFPDVVLVMAIKENHGFWERVQVCEIDRDKWDRLGKGRKSLFLLK